MIPVNFDDKKFCYGYDGYEANFQFMMEIFFIKMISSLFHCQSSLIRNNSPFTPA